MLGNGRLEAQCFDGEKRLALIRGKMRKKVWINTGDIILLSLREFQDEKADVIQKYTPDEARGTYRCSCAQSRDSRLQRRMQMLTRLFSLDRTDLIKHKEIPATAKINEAEAGDDEGGDVQFEEDSGDDDDDDLDDI